MSCPHFEPVAPLEWQTWPAPLRPPLGAPYSGVCHAAPAPLLPDRATLIDKCNMGYASECCPHFKPGSGDAVRFSVACGDERPPVILWLVESGCLPILSGEVPLAAAESGTQPPGAPPRLGAQLRAYAAAYSACNRS